MHCTESMNHSVWASTYTNCFLAHLVVVIARKCINFNEPFVATHWSCYVNLTTQTE
eukprot:m.68714 g.68714  ORF g.68714 m.68714 type:complete len:56 (-) comp12203_c0_seq1:274-441(-)